ncbi:hypothetical protein C8F01DRAFT_1231219 [Mycena amicta]|nr:hypothetical protein C8F01DRAFT_1231219 [Mycena amicta]
MTRNSELRSRLAETTSGIADLERQLAQLRAYKRQLDVKLRAIVYPILTIPSEITAEILCHAVADSPIEWILAATRVCALWRTVALSTPRMWNASYQRAWSRKKDPINLLQLWLSRSGSLPLHITLDVSQDGERVLALLARHISRWHRVELFGALCSHPWLDNGPAPFLSLHGEVPSPLVDVDSDSCPKWRGIVLCHTKAEPTALLPTLSKVTSVELREVASALVPTVLRHTPKVKYLTVQHRQRLNCPPIFLPRVHTLYHRSPGLLNHLSLPALKDLHVASDLLPTPKELESFLTRSGCTLWRVRWESFSTTGAIIGFLRVIPSVQVFILPLGDYEPHEAKIIAFLNAVGAGEVLPQVETLALYRISRRILPKLQSALHSKTQLPTCRLKKLILEVQVPVSGDLVPQSLRSSMAEKGVELQVTSTYSR